MTDKEFFGGYRDQVVGEYEVEMARRRHLAKTAKFWDFVLYASIFSLFIGFYPVEGRQDWALFVGIMGLYIMSANRADRLADEIDHLEANVAHALGDLLERHS